MFLYLDHVVVVVVVVVLCTGDDKMGKLTSDLESMGFRRPDIENAVTKIGGPQRVHGPEPLASTTQATIDAIVAKQEGESVGG